MVVEQIITKLRVMTLIDEFTRTCLAIRVARRINAIGATIFTQNEFVHVLEIPIFVLSLADGPAKARFFNGRISLFVTLYRQLTWLSEEPLPTKL